MDWLSPDLGSIVQRIFVLSLFLSGLLNLRQVLFKLGGLLVQRLNTILYLRYALTRYYDSIVYILDYLLLLHKQFWLYLRLVVTNYIFKLILCNHQYFSLYHFQIKTTSRFRLLQVFSILWCDPLVVE